MNETFAVKNNKFNNGEISPDLYGDVKHPKYEASLRTCKDWLPIPTGAIKKRPGTLMIDRVKNDLPAILRRFVFSDAQVFTIEFGNLYARFYSGTQYVGNDNLLHSFGSATPYLELVTPWTEAMLPYLKFKQIGDTITVTMGTQLAAFPLGIAPRDIKHTSNAPGPWTIGATATRLPLLSLYTTGSLVNVQAWSVLVPYRMGDMVAQNHVLWVSLQDSNLATPPPAPAPNAALTGLAGNLYWTPAVDASHPAIRVMWAFTMVVQDPFGVTYESSLQEVLAGTGPLSSDRHVPLFINFGGSVWNSDTGTGIGLPAGWTLLMLRVYRTSAKTDAGPFGWLSDVAQSNPLTVTQYIDDGREPDYSIQPPGTNPDPFLVNGADSYPAVVGLIDQRRAFFGGAGLPSGGVVSAAGDLYRFDTGMLPGADTDAFKLLLVSDVLEQIRSFAEMRRGILLTSMGEWTLSGPNGGSVLRSIQDLRPQSRWGTSWLDPLIIGTGLLFNTSKGDQVRDFYPLYGIYSDIWDGQDLTVMSRHFFTDHLLSAWAFQTVPYPVAWVCRDDGVLLSLTYQHAPPSFGQQLTDGVVAWAQHSLGPGSQVRSVCVTPELPGEAVNFVVERAISPGSNPHNTRRFIEKLSSFDPPTRTLPDGGSEYIKIAGAAGDYWLTVRTPDVRLYVGSDCATISDGRNTTSTTMTVGADAGGGASILTASNNVFESLVVVGDYIVIIDNGLVSGKYAEYRCKITGYIDHKTVNVQIETPGITFNTAIYNVNWGYASRTANVPHLQGLLGVETDFANACSVLADGDYDPGATYAGGVVTFTNPTMISVIGFRITADALLLDAVAPNLEIRNKFKGLKRIGFEVANTRDLFVGRDFDSLEQWIQRQASDGSAIPLATGYFEQFVKGGYNKYGRAAIRHSTPFPATITSVLREFHLGDS